jgi:hypothetical protein
MVLGSAGDRQDVVEAHRDVGDQDLDDRLPQGLARGARRSPIGDRRHALVLFGDRIAVMAAVPQLAVHLPADPQQQNAARQDDADDAQQLHRDRREGDTHDGRSDDAPEDRLPALIGRQASGRHADDDGVVPSQDEVDK